MRKSFFILLLSCFLFVGVIAETFGINTYSAQAIEQEEIMENNIENMSLMGGDTSGGVFLVQGKGTGNQKFTGIKPIASFTDITYIPNANYFLLNPQHHENDGSDNEKGTCTTVALQMLLGYHNYYSDRRIIPDTSNGKTFLAGNYGDIENHPMFNRHYEFGQGCPMIGTADAVYDEIFAKNTIASNPTIGQAIPLVLEAVEDFLDEFTPQEVRESISLSWGNLFPEEARLRINEGKPVVLGMVSESQAYHVVPAYGYAKLDGVNGFFVHYGWGDDGIQVWVPESYFGFIVRMSVNHTHTLTDTGTIVKGIARKLECGVCGYQTVDMLYETVGSEISNVKYPLVGGVSIPRSITTYVEDTASFTTTAITSIGANAFENQKQITSVTIPNTVTSIGEEAFSGCSALTNVTIPSSVTSIGQRAFKGCTSLTSITIPSSVTEIGYSAFEGCTNLTNVNLQANITSIKDGVFYQCRSLSAITIPTSVTEIQGDAFLGCIALTNITIPSNVTSIEEFAFSGCTGLTSVTLPSGLLSIGNSAFNNCTSLTSIEIPSSVTTIANLAFSGCTGLTSVEIPSSVTSIGEGAFTSCTNLNITVSANNPYYTAENNILYNKDKSAIVGAGNIAANIIIPETVTAILPRAFHKNSNLESVHIYGKPMIDRFAFYDNVNEKDIYFYSYEVPTIGTNAFYRACVTLYVPHSVKSDYETAFVNYEIELIPITLTIIDGGTISWFNTYYGAQIIGEHVPMKAGYRFLSCTDQNSNTYGIGEDWYCKQDITVSVTWLAVAGADNIVCHVYLDQGAGSGGTESVWVEYLSAMPLATAPTREYYYFKGYYSEPYGNGVQYYNWDMSSTRPWNIPSGKTLYAFWGVDYTVYYDGNGGDGEMLPSEFSSGIGGTLRLNAFTRAYYDFMGWSTSPSGSAEFTDGQTINFMEVNGGEITLYAVWKAKIFAIDCKNLTTDMLVDIETYTFDVGLSQAQMPKIYLSGAGLLKNFYGWYTSTSFTTQVHSISTAQTGTVTLYAKYDYWISTTKLSTTQTVTDGDIDDQPSFSVDIMLDSVYFDRVKNTALDWIRIDISFDMWEINDGYQDLYLYCGDTVVWSKTIDRSSSVDSNPTKEPSPISLSLSTYQNIDLMDLKFAAHGTFGDKWQFNNFEMSIYFSHDLPTDT